MKCILHIALLPMLGAAVCYAADEGKNPFKHPVAAHFGACPDGHKALVDVPIIWGLVGPLVKKPADYDERDRELKLKEERGEIVFGGDCLPTDPPKTQVVCRQCGFHYCDFGEPEGYPVMDFWLKRAKTPEEFRIKFSETLLSFPLLDAVRESISYSQTLSANGTQLDDESVSYHTALPFDEALKAMRKWLIDHQRNPADLKPMEVAPAPPADPFASPDVANSKRKKSESGVDTVVSPPGSRILEYNHRTVSLTLREDWLRNPGQVGISLWIKKGALNPVKNTVSQP
jgi:hypothetical protein